MGILIKVVLFGLVIYYIVKSIGSFVYRILGGQPQKQARQAQPNKQKGEINIDYMPKGKKGGNTAGSKDGDYIDYEEVK